MHNQGKYVEQAYDELRELNRQHCHLHPQLPVNLFCVDCQRYLCTKCLIAERQEHATHELVEVGEVYEQVKEKLELEIKQNKRMTESSRHKQAAVVTQM